MYSNEVLVETRKAKGVAEKLLNDSNKPDSTYEFDVWGYVEETPRGGRIPEDVKETTVGEWLTGLAVACGKEVNPAEIAEISFQLGKLVGREGFVEVPN